MKQVPVISDFLLLFLYKFLKNPTVYLHSLRERYGDICAKKYNGSLHYFLFHPEYAEHLFSIDPDNYRKYPEFVKNFEPLLGTKNLLTIDIGEQWQRDRDLAQTAFDVPVFFERYAEKIARNCAAMMDEWQAKFVSKGLLCPIGRELDKLALLNINTTLFHHLKMDADVLSQWVPNIFELIKKKMISLTKIPWLLPTKRKRTFDRYMRGIEELKKEALLSRIKEGKDYDDLLGSFLSEYKVKGEGCPHFNAVANHVMTFDIVGYLAITAALRNILVTVIQNPEIGERISAEFEKVCQGLPTYADCEKLVYTQAAVKEILRLNPPIAFMLREVIHDAEVRGLVLQEGSCAVFAPYLIHRHPDYWEQPDTLNPERFLSKPYGQDYPYAYIPFGSGKRSCVAKNFSLFELCLITAMMVHRFSFILPKGYKAKEKYIAIIRLLELEEITVKEKK